MPYNPLANADAYVPKPGEYSPVLNDWNHVGAQPPPKRIGGSLSGGGDYPAHWKTNWAAFAPHQATYESTPAFKFNAPGGPSKANYGQPDMPEGWTAPAEPSLVANNPYDTFPQAGGIDMTPPAKPDAVSYVAQAVQAVPAILTAQWPRRLMADAIQGDVGKALAKELRPRQPIPQAPTLELEKGRTPKQIGEDITHATMRAAVTAALAVDPPLLKWLKENFPDAVLGTDQL